MQLLDLPDDILLSIWTVVLPDDIDNFAFTCRHLRSLARGLLQEHRQLRAAHTHISMYECRSSRILLNYGENQSRLSLYPRSLTLIPDETWLEIPEKDESQESDESQENDDKAVLSLLALMKGEDRTFPWESIAAMIETQDPQQMSGMIVAIAARFLPNLETMIYIEDDLRSDPPFHFVDGLVIGMMELAMLPISPPAFPRLSRLSITRTPTIRVPGDLEPFLFMLCLPNLRSFEASEFSCLDFDSLPFPPRTSKVETLDLSPAIYKTSSIVALLGAFEALKTFKLRIIGIPTSLRYEWLEGLFSAVHLTLLNYFQNSLERLELSDNNPEREYFGSLRRFSVLKSVTIQPDLLCTDLDTMPRLIDVFPDSIQEIILTRRLSERQEREFFTGFFGHRQTSMPHLRSVVMSHLLSLHYDADVQLGRDDYWFRYIQYYHDTPTVRVIDPDADYSEPGAIWWKVLVPESSSSN